RCSTHQRSTLFPYSPLFRSGLRFGYLAGDPAWISQIDKVRPPYNINVLTQAALRTVLRHKAVLDEQAAHLRAGRAALAAGLAALDRKSTRLNSSHVKTSYAV